MKLLFNALLGLKFQQWFYHQQFTEESKSCFWISELYLLFEEKNGPGPFVWFSFSLQDNSMFVYAVSCYFKKLTLKVLNFFYYFLQASCIVFSAMQLHYEDERSKVIRK